MDEFISVLQDILFEIRRMNEKLDQIVGSGTNSIDDVCDKLDSVIGDGLFNSLSDVCEKIDALETTITLGENY